MKGILSGAVLIGTLVMLSGGAFAQAEVDPQKEFEQKMRAMMKEGAVQDTSSDILGPGGTLPVEGGLPAAAPQTPEDLQAQMETEAEAQQKKLEEQTFDMALKVLLPLKPEQIRKLLETFKDSREAAETPLRVPQPLQEVQAISLDPGQEPLIVKTVPGYVTTITVLDSTGSPWPIQDVSWAGQFEVTPPEEGGHVFRVTPKSAHGAGNISVRLVDLITPVTLTLRTSLDEVHYRLDVRLPKQGPLAKTPLIEYGGLKTVAGTDSNLVDILDGTPPGNAERLAIKGADGRAAAYRVDGKIYLRTALTLLSPAWDSSVESADGMNVYTLNDTPVILLSDEGKMVRVQLAAEEGTP